MVNIWGVIALETLNQNRRSRDPLADPLDRPEWRGLSWIFERRRREPAKMTDAGTAPDRCETGLWAAAVGARRAG
jgi:hypothetical protein